MVVTKVEVIAVVSEEITVAETQIVIVIAAPKERRSWGPYLTTPMAQDVSSLTGTLERTELHMGLNYTFII